MSSTNFVDQVTPIVADWLNDVNASTYGPTSPPGTLRDDLANTTDPTKGAAMVGRAAAIVNVMDFGGVGTGLVDDTPAFNAAIAALPAAGGTVVWPVGHIFALNLVITKPGVKIQGPGITNAETVPVGNYLTHYNPALPVIQIGNDTGIVSGVTISDSQFYGANVGSIGLYFAGGAYRCNYDNVYISNFATSCVKFKGGTTYPCTYIRGVNVGISPSQSGSDGYFIDGAVSLPSYTTAIYLTNFDISAPNTSGHAVRLNSRLETFLRDTFKRLIIKVLLSHLEASLEGLMLLLTPTLQVMLFLKQIPQVYILRILFVDQCL